MLSIMWFSYFLLLVSLYFSLLGVFILLESKFLGVSGGSMGPNKACIKGGYQFVLDMLKLGSKKSVFGEGLSDFDSKSMLSLVLLLVCILVVSIISFLTLPLSFFGKNLGWGFVWVLVFNMALVILKILVISLHSSVYLSFISFSFYEMFMVMEMVYSFLYGVLVFLLGVLGAGSWGEGLGVLDKMGIWDSVTCIMGLGPTLILLILITLLKVSSSPFDYLESESEVVGGASIEFTGLYFLVWSSMEYSLIINGALSMVLLGGVFFYPELEVKVLLDWLVYLSVFMMVSSAVYISYGYKSLPALVVKVCILVFFFWSMFFISITVYLLKGSVGLCLFTGDFWEVSELSPFSWNSLGVFIPYYKLLGYLESWMWGIKLPKIFGLDSFIKSLFKKLVSVLSESYFTVWEHLTSYWTDEWVFKAVKHVHKTTKPYKDSAIKFFWYFLDCHASMFGAAWYWTKVGCSKVMRYTLLIFNLWKVYNIGCLDSLSNYKCFLDVVIELSSILFTTIPLCLVVFLFMSLVYNIMYDSFSSSAAWDNQLGLNPFFPPGTFGYDSWDKLTKSYMGKMEWSHVVHLNNCSNLYPEETDMFKMEMEEVISPMTGSFNKVFDGEGVSILSLWASYLFWLAVMVMDWLSVGFEMWEMFSTGSWSILDMADLDYIMYKSLKMGSPLSEDFDHYILYECFMESSGEVNMKTIPESDSWTLEKGSWSSMKISFLDTLNNYYYSYHFYNGGSSSSSDLESLVSLSTMWMVGVLMVLELIIFVLMLVLVDNLVLGLVTMCSVVLVMLKVSNEFCN